MYAAPAKLHFQFASNDEWVQTLEQVDLYRAASQPKSRRCSKPTSCLTTKAKKDQHAWLRRVLLGKLAGIKFALGPPPQHRQDRQIHHHRHGCISPFNGAENTSTWDSPRWH